MSKESITEEMNIQKEWFENARKQTTESLPEFIKHLTEDYAHDYGTICHAIVAAALAGACAVDNSPCGGITGFQAGCIMWEFIHQFMFQNNKCGLKLIDYDELLYPQNEKLITSISKGNLQKIQEEAANEIREHKEAHEKWVLAHEQWVKDMEKFKIDVVEWQKQHSEYPKYADDPQFYEHLSYGKQEEWEAERKKEESGFMFAPEEPCEPTVSESVMQHWKMLADGGVPFGLKVTEE